MSCKTWSAVHSDKKGKSTKKADGIAQRQKGSRTDRHAVP